MLSKKLILVYTRGNAMEMNKIDLKLRKYLDELYKKPISDQEFLECKQTLIDYIRWLDRMYEKYKDVIDKEIENSKDII